MQSEQTTAVGSADALHPRLPAELLSLVITHLDTQSRARLLRVNSALHALAVKATYSRLRLFSHPRDTKQQPLPLQGRNAPSYAAHVVFVDVPAHPLKGCCWPIDGCTSKQEDALLARGLLGTLPNLRTLRLHLGQGRLEGLLHDDMDAFPCPAVSSLRPRTLVVRGAVFRADEESFLAEPESTLSDGLVSSLEHLVCVVSAGTDGDGYSIQSGIVRLIGAQMTSATFVFFTPDRHARVLPASDDVVDEVEWWLEAVAGEIGSHAPLDNCRLTFVNAGAVGALDGGDEDAGAGTVGVSGAKQRSLESYFREEVAKRCREIGLDDRTIARRQESIRFITMDEYLVEPESLDVFDADELSEPAAFATTDTLGALIPPLPNEILAHVIGFLDTQSRARLLQVNSAFYALALVPTYTHLRLFDHAIGDRAPLPLQGRAAVHATHVRLIDTCPHPTSACALPLGYNYDSEHFLTYGLLGCALPHLRSLRLRLLTTEWYDNLLHRTFLGALCPALANLRPTTLVIRDATLLADEESLLADPAGTMPQQLIDAVEHLVVVLSDRCDESDVEGGSDAGEATMETDSPLIGQRMAAATFVLMTDSRGERFRSPISLVRLWLSSFVQRISANRFSKIRLTLVNTEAAREEPAAEGEPEPEPDGTAVDDSHESWFRKELARHCRTVGMDDAVVARRQELVRFISMDEFLAEPGVLDVFEVDELDGWWGTGL
ncbi:uncharacterized protein LOC62_05G007294 [Vanrija pseudolonga]|uniref:F-box domain-containing protein n=1 Tax=Vanrija pseudolonga TaxID=143232 RepID=A0AAF1BJR4_9TREE|nr:hypothetical protein LOC62_05G007294 [Vanrija pseudolonga]